MTNNPPPGWHPDPSNSAQIRYWDGNQWTEHTKTTNQSESNQDSSNDSAAGSGNTGSGNTFTSSLQNLKSSQESYAEKFPQPDNPQSPSVSNSLDNPAPMTIPASQPSNTSASQSRNNQPPLGAEQKDFQSDNLSDRPSFLAASAIGLAISLIASLLFVAFYFVVTKLLSFDTGSINITKISESGLLVSVLLSLLAVACVSLIYIAYLRLTVWLSQKVFDKQAWQYRSLWHLAAAFAASGLAYFPLSILIQFGAASADLPFFATIIISLISYAFIIGFFLQRTPSLWGRDRSIIVTVIFLTIPPAMFLALASIALYIGIVFSAFFSDVSKETTKADTTVIKDDFNLSENQSSSTESDYKSGDRVSYIAQGQSGIKYRVSFTMPQTKSTLTLNKSDTDSNITESLNWSYIPAGGGVGDSTNDAATAFEGDNLPTALKDDRFSSKQPKVLGQGKGVSSNEWAAILDDFGGEKSAVFRVSNPLLNGKSSFGDNEYYGFEVNSRAVGFTPAQQMVKTIVFTKLP